jgi:hypothetical protein
LYNIFVFNKWGIFSIYFSYNYSADSSNKKFVHEQDNVLKAKKEANRRNSTGIVECAIKTDKRQEE